MTVEVANADALASLTGALVDANDRLLGLLSLVTNDPPRSLDAAEMIDAIADRAAPILDLATVEVDGIAQHVWSRGVRPADNHWTTDIELDDIGELTLTFGRADGRFDTGDTKLLAAVARLIANAVVTSQVHRKTLDQELVAREHATAAQVAATALRDPATMPVRSGLSFYATLTPARETGGDLFTWQEIGDSIWFAMGDVSGKGLPAAVVMSTAVSAVEASIARMHAGGPVAVVAAVDEWLHDRLSKAAMFVTLAIGEWNTATNELRLVNHGHSPILWCSASHATRVEATAPPLGVIAGLVSDEWSRTTADGDTLLLATDGFTEQHNAAGELFGEDRFDASVLAASTQTDAAAIGQTLVDELVEHGRGCEQSDDRALMVLRFGQ